MFFYFSGLVESIHQILNIQSTLLSTFLFILIQFIYHNYFQIQLSQIVYPYFNLSNHWFQNYLSNTFLNEYSYIVVVVIIISNIKIDLISIILFSNQWYFSNTLSLKYSSIIISHIYHRFMPYLLFDYYQYIIHTCKHISTERR